jgi:NAD(P)-dependent dehydrogenase (short-subunit alcohol dehydrogenase family)
VTAAAPAAGTTATSASERLVVVTGATGGLGFELARRFARTKSHVVLACRSLPRAEATRERLLSEVSGARVTALPLDLAEPASIREFGARFERDVGYVDVLVNNAGIFGVPLSYNSAGQELHLATNYLGPFALTGLLLPLFRDRPGARIVNVGSLAHRTARSSLGAPGPKDYSAFKAYARSKLALLTHTVELSRRLRGRNVIAVSAHPGVAPTDIAKNHPIANPKTALGRWFTRKMEQWIPTIAAAVEPIVHAASAEDVRGGDYYGPGGWLEFGGAPAKARLNARASDEAAARQLWSLSEALTGVRYLSATAAPNPVASRTDPTLWRS